MCKHSLVAFSDTLRREVSRFGVRVSSIEPAFFRTAITDSKSLVKQLDENWGQTSDDVKKAYGNFERERKLAINLDKIVPIGNDIDVVVDDIIDSVMNCSPKAVYSPRVGILDKIMIFICMYFPVNVVDYLIDLEEKVILNIY